MIGNLMKVLKLDDFKSDYKIKPSDLIFGDCIEAMKFIEDKTIDMILCDLPYGSTKAKWDSVLNLSDLWFQYERIIKDNGAILLFAQTPFDKILGSSNLKMLKYEWIWEKSSATGHLNAKKMPMKCHENILVFYKNLPTYNPQMTTGHKRKVSTAHHKRTSKTSELYGKSDNFTNYDSTERYPRSVIEFKSDKQILNLHSTQKPLSLCEYLIKTYTNKGDLVLDNTAGSMTTAIAAINTERNWICMENDNEIFCKGENRIKKRLLND